MQLTLREMLDYRRKCAGFGPLESQWDIERYDTADIDGIVEAQLRLWYLDLLDKGDERYVEYTDISPMSEVIEVIGRTATIAVPPEAHKILHARLPGWERPAKALYGEDAYLCHLRQLNPYTAATNANPVCYRLDGCNVYAAPAGANAAEDVVVDMLLATYDYGKNIYCFKEAALSTMPDIGF